MILTCQCEDWKKNDRKTCVYSKMKNPTFLTMKAKTFRITFVDSNAFPMGMWQKVYSHRFCRLVTNTLGQTTSCGMEKPKKFEKSWTMNEIEANFLQKFDKVEQVMKMKLRFDSPFPTKGIHSLNSFLVIDKFYLNLSSWWTIVSKMLFLLCGMAAGSKTSNQKLPLLDS